MSKKSLSERDICTKFISDFKHFRYKMTVVEHRQIDQSYEICLALYQDLSGSDEEENDTSPIIDEETGEKIKHEPVEFRTPPESFEPNIKEPSKKVYVDGVDVSILVNRELYFDQHGKPIIASLKDHTKEIIKEFGSKDKYMEAVKELENELYKIA